MTSITRIRTARVSNTVQDRQPHSAVAWLNMVLAGLILALLLCYVVQKNALASQAWQMRATQDQLARVRENGDTLIAQQGVLDDRVVLEQLATTGGLVPAGAPTYLIQDGAVAAR